MMADLLRVQNDIATALDDHSDVVLILLDLTAAFDLVDHSILLSRLESRYGVSGTVLNWFKSYLHQRLQSVKVGDSLSSVFELCGGVPQGSVLGPILFTLYVAPIEDIISEHGLNYAVYADDTQLYIRVGKPLDMVNAIIRLQHCIATIIEWLNANKLVCNTSKTEVIQFCSKFINHQHLQTINIAGSEISFSSSVRNLGVIFDQNLTMTHHVNNACKSAWFSLKRIYIWLK